MEKIDNKFNFFWNNIILPVINKSFYELDNEFKNNKNAKIKELNNLKKSICDSYHFYRENFKKKFHKKNTEAKLDLLKISSIMCYSIIKNKPVKFDSINDININEIIETKTSFIINNYLINYKIAFRVALGFVFMDMLYKYKKDEQIFNQILQNPKLKLYNYNNFDNNNQDSVEEMLIKNFAINDIYERDFDFLMFTSLMVGIKEYNETFLK